MILVVDVPHKIVLLEQLVRRMLKVGEGVSGAAIAHLTLRRAANTSDSNIQHYNRPILTRTPGYSYQHTHACLHSRALTHTLERTRTHKYTRMQALQHVHTPMHTRADTHTQRHCNAMAVL